MECRAHGSDCSVAVCRAARIFFYIGVVCVALIVAHVIIVLVCRRMGLPGPPKVLEFPRLELWLALAILQPFGQACGRAPLTPHPPKP
jgi:hypothetical protein